MPCKYEGVCVLLYVIISAIVTAETAGGHGVRHRRALWDFSEVILCMTGRSAYNDFNGYGCWCGSGGWGLPVDETDRCCFNHDECYGAVMRRPECWSITPYVGGYDFTCQHGNVQCSRDQGSCIYDTCLCDREMGECLTRTQYNEDFAPGWAGSLWWSTREEQCCATVGEDCTYTGNIEWKSWCSENGEINLLQSATGLPSEFARFYSMSVTGNRGSALAVDDDGPSITYYKRCFYDIAHRLALSPALVGALASRLSMGGRQLNDAGFNINFPFLHGLFGCDTRLYTCPGTDDRTCEYAEQTIQRQLMQQLEHIRSAQPSLTAEDVLRRGLMSYLGTVSSANDQLASKQFADDVIARAHRLDSFHRWRCSDDERYVPATDPVQVGSNDTCLALARAGSCDFYQRCLELRRPCYDQGFAISHGQNFCLRYRHHHADFTPEGQTWIDRMLACTMKSVYGYVRFSCERSNKLAQQAETRCMKAVDSVSEEGFCGTIADNIDAMRAVYEGGIDQLPISTFARTKLEKELWSQVYDQYVSCMYGCETTVQGEECGSWYKNLWHSFRSSFIFRFVGRRRRSVEECSGLAESGDCGFWQCIEDEFGCGTEQATSMARHFKLPFCFKINSIVDARVRRLMRDTEQCVMRSVAESADARESCLDLEFTILTAQTECLPESGVCSVTKADEWVLERLTNLKGYPASMPKDLGKVSAAGRYELLTATYHEWLQYFRQQLGQAHRLCYYRGAASSPDLYTLSYSQEAGGYVKYRTGHTEL